MSYKKVGGLHFLSLGSLRLQWSWKRKARASRAHMIEGREMIGARLVSVERDGRRVFEVVGV